ncbi:MAG: hypothetical protein NTX55_01185 [Candidatus Parcubacteria bacterium]|nr:hypothetical protein [Candidatus Parcubacteria bacterium]
MKSKIHTLRFRAVNRDIFEAIKRGKKKIETRAATKKYRNIKTGDKVRLICEKDKFERRVGKVKIFKTISAMLRKYKVKDIAPNLNSKKELMKLYCSFPGYREKTKKFGLITTELI